MLPMGDGVKFDHLGRETPLPLKSIQFRLNRSLSVAFRLKTKQRLCVPPGSVTDVKVPVQPRTGIPSCWWTSCPSAGVAITLVHEIPVGVVPSSRSLTETE